MEADERSQDMDEADSDMTNLDNGKREPASDTQTLDGYDSNDEILATIAKV